MRASGAVALLMLLPFVAAAPAVDENPFVGWHVELPGPLRTSLPSVSIALDATGSVYVAATQRVNSLPVEGGQSFSMVFVRNGVTWSETRARSDGAAIDIHVDKNGEIHILTLAQTGLRYSSSSNGWSAEALSDYSTGSLVELPDGTIHVMTSSPAHDLRWYSRSPGGVWTYDLVATSNRNYEFGEAGVTSDGRVFALAAQGSTNLYLESRSATGVWSEQAVPTCRGSPFASLAVQASGPVHLACEDSSRVVNHVVWDGLSWSSAEIPAAGDDLLQISVTPSGTVGIGTVYRDSTGIHLGYYSETILGWTRETVDPARGVSSLGIIDMKADTIGRPHFAYTVNNIVGEPGTTLTVPGNLRHAESMSSFASALTQGLVP